MSFFVVGQGVCSQQNKYVHIINTVQTILDETQKSMPGLIAQTMPTASMDDAEYQAFTQSLMLRHKQYVKLLKMAQSLQVGDSEVLKNLKVDVIRLIGLRQTVDMTYQSCIQARRYSYPENYNNSCFDPAIAPVALDYRNSRIRIKATLSDLESGKALGNVKVEQKAKTNPTPTHPNIVLVVVDALRADAVGAYRDVNSCRTPKIDNMAKSGVMFKDITSASSTTNTSIASLFSGKNPYAVHANGSQLWDFSQSLIPVFRDNGYFTFGISANSLIWPENHYDNGFKIFFGRYWSHAGIMIHELDSCLTAMNKLPEPFFLYLHLVDPHDPYFAPDKAEQALYHKPRQGFEVNPNTIRDKYIDSLKNPATLLPKGNIDYLRKLYCDEVSYADQHIGKLITLLETHKMLKNTLVIITADHGEQFLEHGDVKHSRQLYQELVHVPLIFWGKLPSTLKPGTTIKQSHSLMQLLPSLLAWLKIHSDAVPSGYSDMFSEKRSGYPIISTATGLSFDMKHKDSELVALRYGDIKLIVDLSQNKSRLYQISEDPKERRDLSEVYAYLVAALRIQVNEISSTKNRGGGKTPRVMDEANDELKKQLKSLGYLK